MNDEKKKGQMARELVYCCLRWLKITLVWAMAITTAALILDRSVNLSDILIFAAAAFGGELLMLLAKRVFAKPTDKLDDETKG